MTPPETGPSGSDEIPAREGWAHVGCPTCGFVAQVPLDRIEPCPWCCHAERVIWRDPHPESAIDWTRTVRVTVAALSRERSS